MKRMMSNQIENDRNKDNDDKDYHFSKGKAGRIVRWLLRIGKRPETVDETVTAPAVLTLMAFLWADKHPDCGQLPIWVYVASVAAAGTWYGLVRGGPELVLPLLRGTLTGGLAAMALYLCLPHIAQPQEWSSISGNMVMIGMDLFFFAHALSAIGREFLLTTEEQWQKGIERRRKIRALFSRNRTHHETGNSTERPTGEVGPKPLRTFAGFIAETQSLEGKPTWIGLLANAFRSLFEEYATNALKFILKWGIWLFVGQDRLRNLLDIIWSHLHR
ncbi:hypothetical protein [Acetobacter tropicalis]|uniref:hypothetical protein n=1 Tax=Acetobacter tropicalis TaxID=104102 RepID=UPI00165729EA|nr:hypothetical protein [Acetobacter tropicalis]MBC9008869.1 hypothetical protein [Acetobacter tropicalis]